MNVSVNSLVFQSGIAKPSCKMPRQPTSANQINATDDSKTEESESGVRESTVILYVVVSLFSGIIIGLCFSGCIFFYIRRRGLRNNISEARSTEPAENEAYQELDITKLSKDENYQSLDANEGTYQELNLSEMSDAGENYQSLIVNAARGKKKKSQKASNECVV